MSQADLVRTLTAAAALSAFSRIIVDSSGEAALASNNGLSIGVLQKDVAADDPAPVRLYAPTFMMMASGAITAGSQVYPAANGKVSGSQVTDAQVGVAIEAATADRDIIEIAITLNS